MSLAQALVLPLVVHVLLTVAVGALSLKVRVAALRGGRVRMTEIALDNAAWPDEARKLGNNFDNQFQVPMLAYAGVSLLLATGLADGLSAALLWVFIVARLLHTLEHTRTNNVRRRFAYFLVSFASVLALWLWFALRFLVIG